MRIGILLIMVLFSASGLRAQNFRYAPSYENLNKYSVIDSAYLKCAYKLTYLKDSLKPEEKSSDAQVLWIGKTCSKYYSQYALAYNLYVVEYLKKHDTYPRIKEVGSWTYELFKHYPQGKETVTDIASMLQGNFVYEEEMPVFDWKITNETQEVLSYNCQKATCSFRGRIYTAWFTLDIPVDNGPWKFGGLPGLILKIYDSKNHFVYECEGLEQLKTKEPVKFYKLDYTKVNREELNKLYRRFHDDFAAYMKLKGVKVNVMDPETKKFKTVDHSSSKLPYNPIELE
ncbi:MAG: GLPGLI family protein [Dysgonamonadaceae bacterium]|jgi:GLPGLI family protein|nr:GLPGLI family protein [Dysgonamonadaceae bacterium]